jgi:hypothetical protein
VAAEGPRYTVLFRWYLTFLLVLLILAIYSVGSEKPMIACGSLGPTHGFDYNFDWDKTLFTQNERLTQETPEFKGKRILVTGGTRGGIGEAVVERLIRSSGRVITTARSPPAGDTPDLLVQTDISTHEGSITSQRP